MFNLYWKIRRTIRLAVIAMIVLGMARQIDFVTKLEHHARNIAENTSAWIAKTGITSAQARPGNTRVIDGDTIEWNGRRVRLEGIDAPESAQQCTRANTKKWNCGAEATRALRKLVDSQTLQCEGTATDRYGRLIATCHTLGSRTEVNRWMVRNGWALAYRQYSGQYVNDENRARKRTRRDLAGNIRDTLELAPGKRLEKGTIPTRNTAKRTTTMSANRDRTRPLTVIGIVGYRLGSDIDRELRVMKEAKRCRAILEEAGLLVPLTVTNKKTPSGSPKHRSDQGTRHEASLERKGDQHENHDQDRQK